MTTRDTPEAVLAAAIIGTPRADSYLPDANPEDVTPWAATILAALDGWTLVPAMPVERCAECGVPFTAHPYTDACAIAQEARGARLQDRAALAPSEP